MSTQAGSKLLGWAAPLGRTAFTNYLLQSLIFGFVFYGYGLGLFGKVGVTTTLCFGTAVYLGQVMLSRWVAAQSHLRSGRVALAPAYVRVPQEIAV